MKYRQLFSICQNVYAVQILMTRDYVYLLRAGIVDWRNVDCYYAVYNMKMFIINIYGIVFFITLIWKWIKSLRFLSFFFKRAIAQLICNLREVEFLFVITLVVLINEVHILIFVSFDSIFSVVKFWYYFFLLTNTNIIKISQNSSHVYICINILF